MRGLRGPVVDPHRHGLVDGESERQDGRALYVGRPRRFEFDTDDQLPTALVGLLLRERADFRAVRRRTGHMPVAVRLLACLRSC